MTVISKLAVSCLVAAGTVLVVQHGATALHATLPKDMPGNAQFLQSGYDLARNEPEGEWIACRSDAARNADFCRVTDPLGAVIYQGDFLPVSGAEPVLADHLKVATNDDKADLWIDGPTADGPIPVIPLASGDVLAPAVDQPVLAARWSRDPDSLKRLQGE